MQNVYDPKTIENDCHAFWEKQHINQHRTISTNKPTYCIMLPPPNVTGSLHMGHAFQQTLMDALIRYKRMQGEQTLWQTGTDHAGIATQILVEQQLLKKGITREALGREAFIQRVWQWRDESGNQIMIQMHRLGLSIDWSRARFSMDEAFSEATREAFIQLFRAGLIYRSKRLVNWDPQLHTAVSDLEVESKQAKGHLWYIRYPIVGSSQQLLIATTRPETMLGDVAVAVHPDDERYQSWIGHTLQLPLTDRTIPIIADPDVDPTFGTGCVKITPAHDFTDYAMAERHQLPMINIMTHSATLNDQVPTVYRGLDRFTARKKIIEDLTQTNLLEKIEPHTLAIPYSERSGAIIEPLLTNQWFIKMRKLAKPAIQAVDDASLQLIPPTWKKTYLQWLNHIEDWCISRQLWWGHRLPVWYDDAGQIYVGHNETQVRKKYHLNNKIPLTQETDVLDTWFSASLWPYATLGWPKTTLDYKTFYPTQVLVTGFDIIFFWVARMVMMGLQLTKQIPFQAVYVTGLIRDAHGKKMSKSKGNVLDPLDVIDGIKLNDLIKKRTYALLQPKMADKIETETKKQFPQGIPAYGADALRFSCCALANMGRDIYFNIKHVEASRNFCNKLWNAARFVIMNTDIANINPEKPITYNEADLWIRHRLQQLIANVHQAFKDYRFDKLTSMLHEFTWHEYCDWYVELAKCVLHDKNSKADTLLGTRITLIEILDTLLHLIHPVMPFITETIWRQLSTFNGHYHKSLILTKFPNTDKQWLNPISEQKIEWLKKIIVTIRTMRAEIGISPAKPIDVIFNQGDQTDKAYINLFTHYIQSLGKINYFRWKELDESLQETATDIMDHLEIHIPLAGLIPKASERKRLIKEIEKLKQKAINLNNRLKQPHYLEKAPEAVVQKTRSELSLLETHIKKLEAQYKKIG